MRAIICILLLLSAGKALGQLYTFEKEKLPYMPLEDGIRISGDKPWGDTVFSIPIGFDFTVYKETFDTLHLAQGFAFFGPHLKNYAVGDTSIVFMSFDLDLYDLAYDSLDTSLSPVKYLTTGEEGRRVLTIEYNNVWWDYTDKSKLIFDYQLCFHEYNGTMEIRFGPMHYPRDAPSNQLLGLSKMEVTGVDTFRVLEQTRISGYEDAIYIDEELDPEVVYTFTPEANTVFRFLYDRDIIFNNTGNLGLISGVNSGYDYALQLAHGSILADGSAMLGHGYARQTEWAERYIFHDSVVLKGFVSQHYGLVGREDTAFYKIYLPGPDHLPGKPNWERRISFYDLDLSGQLSYFGFESPMTIKDTFFLAFGVPPYTDYSDNSIGLYYTTADADQEGIFEYGRTAVRFFDGRWYDIYTARIFTGLLGMGITEDSDNLIHLSLAPIVNFFTKNTTPFQHPEGEQYTPLSTYADARGIRLYPHYPNPAKEHLYIRYEVPVPGKTHLWVFDMAGKLLLHETRNDTPDSPHIHIVNLRDWSPGEYIYILQAGEAKISSIFTKTE